MPFSFFTGADFSEAPVDAGGMSRWDGASGPVLSFLISVFAGGASGCDGRLAGMVLVFEAAGAGVGTGGRVPVLRYSNKIHIRSDHNRQGRPRHTLTLEF